MASLLAGVGQLSQLAKLWTDFNNSNIIARKNRHMQLRILQRQHVTQTNTASPTVFSSTTLPNKLTAQIVKLLPHSSSVSPQIDLTYFIGKRAY